MKLCMSKRNNDILLSDMLEAANRIVRYCKNLDYAEFETDQLTIDAVLRNLTILGEASKKVDLEFRNKNNQIEWEKISRSRNIIVHDYFAIDKEIIWKIIKEYIPDLINKLNQCVKK